MTASFTEPKDLQLQDFRTLLQYGQISEVKANDKKKFPKNSEQRNFKNYQYFVSANCAFW